ncbi:MAG: hypothetical protein ACI810_001552, partial [Gammaproteobacteria bacterium]
HQAADRLGYHTRHFALQGYADQTRKHASSYYGAHWKHDKSSY